MPAPTGVQVRDARGLILGDDAEQYNYFVEHYHEAVKPRTPFMAPASATDPLVARDDLSDEVRRMLLGGQSVALVTLPGVGKTALAERLAADPQVRKHFRDGVLWTGLGREPDCLRLLGEWATELGMAPDMLERLTGVEARARAVHYAIGSRRMLLVIDDAWDAGAAETFRLGGPDCAHLLTTRLFGVAEEFSRKGMVLVPELNEEDGLELLRQMAPQVVALEPQSARDLVQAVGGLPLALTLLGGYLRRSTRSGSPKVIRRVMKELCHAERRLRLENRQTPAAPHPSLPPGAAISLEAVIGCSDEALSPEGRAALRALSVLRTKPYTFSWEAAQAVSQASDQTLTSLIEAGLLTPVQQETLGQRFCLHRTIAEYAYTRLSPDDAQDLHLRAASHYAEWLTRCEDEQRDATAYLRCYRYEDPDWQAAMAEWLYHLDRTDRAQAGRALTRAYLDAFWWWGCYTEEGFPFCRRLLEEWGHSQTEEQDREWLAHLQRFHEAYRPGWGDRSDGDWAGVEQALLGLRALAGLDGDAAVLEDPDDRHLRALTNLFLMEAVRYLRPEDPAAEELAREACELFRANEDEWNQCWSLYHLADLHLERKNMDLALKHSQQALALVRSPEAGFAERDCEVISNLHRVQGDAFWSMGALPQAMGNYARAVFYAYAFQVFPKTPPDFYTLSFYREMIERVTRKLGELCGERPSDALAACDYLRSFWQAYSPPEGALSASEASSLIAAGSAARLVERLLPPEPPQEALGNPRSPYPEEVRSLVETMAPAIDEDA